MKKNIFVVLIKAYLAFSAFNLYGQTQPVKYWIPFIDKSNNPFSIERPLEFLSYRALLRREKQSIAITVTDLPVNPFYIDSIKRMGFKIINSSKWLNGVVVSTDDTSLLEKIKKIDFVKQSIKQVSCYPNFQLQKQGIKQWEKNLEGFPDYGNSENQITMLKGDYLHRQGYEGEGMLIAIEDAGFTNANNISSLQNIWISNRVVAMKDFVKDSLSILEAHSHGTLVFSIIAGILSQVMYGTATQANFALIRTEDGGSECIIEEYNWACGAEFADSLGADVINTSLGYSLFNNTSQNHTYMDMDGKTTPIAIAADIAASKGMLIVVSAGNEGANKWRRITTPADAINVLTVGAVDETGIITNFSSRGPSYDKRVKPDVCAQGLSTVAQSENGSIINVSGTSCSAPLITGLATCLWEANPQASNMEIMEAIRQGSSQFEHPDSLYGYGIANFLKSDRILKYGINPVDNLSVHFNLFPNPATDHFYLEVIRPENSANESITINFLDIVGKTLYSEKRNLNESYSILEFQDFQFFPTGIYTLQIVFPDQIHSLLFMKTK